MSSHMILGSINKDGHDFIWDWMYICLILAKELTMDAIIAQELER